MNIHRQKRARSPQSGPLQSVSEIDEKKHRKRDKELEKHLTGLGFTSDAMPTLKMVQEAYRKAILQECIFGKPTRESDAVKEAYNHSFQYIKTAIDVEDGSSHHPKQAHEHVCQPSTALKTHEQKRIRSPCDGTLHGATDTITPDSDEGRNMSITELWDYTKKVLVDNGKDPPKIEVMERLLDLSEGRRRRLLWDIIIHRPICATSFITRLISDEKVLPCTSYYKYLLARTPTTNRKGNSMIQKKRTEHKNELAEHLQKLGFTSDAMPTFEMVHEAYRKAIEREIIRWREFLRDAPIQLFGQGDGLIKLHQEYDKTREAYTQSFEYIKEAICDGEMRSNNESSGSNATTSSS